MSLTPKERRRVYEEEKARIEIREPTDRSNMNMGSSAVSRGFGLGFGAVTGWIAGTLSGERWRVSRRTAVSRVLVVRLKDGQVKRFLPERTEARDGFVRIWVDGTEHLYPESQVAEVVAEPVRPPSEPAVVVIEESRQKAVQMTVRKTFSFPWPVGAWFIMGFVAMYLVLRVMR